jgi:hypothetical protein
VLFIVGCLLGTASGYLLGSAGNRASTPVANVGTPTVRPHTLPAGTPTALALATVLTQDAVRLYGPTSGRLAQYDDNSIAIKSASVTLRDFIAEAEVTNPYDPDTRHGWDYGFVFAAADANHAYRVYITSDGDWSLKRVAIDSAPQRGSPNSDATPTLLPVSAFTAIAGGTSAAIQRETGETNRLRFMVQGTNALLFVNDSFVAIITLPADLPRGDIQLGSAFKTVNNKPDSFVPYKDFSVWSLDR